MRIFFDTLSHLFMSSEIKSYSVRELASWFDNRPSLASLVDVREISELKEQGVIPGYDNNIPYFLTNTDPEQFERRFLALDKHAQLVISCRSGRRSMFAAEYVTKKLGFTNVYNVHGGILAWIENGYPIEKPYL
ncbi:Rhodanese-like domain-containing protein [Gilbertella persicaria]|uniref:Rhodanese-like domain-containing protein n=1 Tax=Gilbertella persicaria TaxID=101096 RepID=UPI00221F787E|nr:Rhodanese-like domain-containing protein [Gilbertella persicaria]KAI8075940.1 Rhodanese-like domain-containing protein [Gilbertella persicaria]